MSLVGEQTAATNGENGGHTAVNMFDAVELAPPSGPVGSVVTITGAGFGTPDAAKYVTFNGLPAVHHLGWIDTLIRTIVPGNAISGQVHIVLSATQSIVGPTFTVTTPTITAISPTNGPPGTLLTIHGNGLGVVDLLDGSPIWGFIPPSPVDYRLVAVNGVPAMLDGWQPHQLGVRVAGNATTGTVQAEFHVAMTGFDSNGLPIITGITTIIATGPTFTVTTPTITNLSHSDGPAGTFLTVHGTNLGATGNMDGSPVWGYVSPSKPDYRVLLINGVPAMLDGWEPDKIGVRIAGNATTGPVRAEYHVATTGFGNNGLPAITGTTTIAATGPTFTVTTPTITGLSHTDGPAGTFLTVHGTNLGTTGNMDGSPVWGYVPPSKPDYRVLLINGVPAMLDGWTPDQIGVRVAGNTTTGPVQAQFHVATTGFDSNGLPAITGTTTITVTGPTFTVTTPAITSLAPTSGPASTRLTISGANLGTTGYMNGSPVWGYVPPSKPDYRVLLINGVPVQLDQWNPDQISVRVPANATTGPTQAQFHVATTGFDGSGIPTITGTTTITATGPTFTVTAPTITSVSPAHGPAGTTVDLYGSGFGNEPQTVHVGDVSVQPLSWSADHIVIQVPGGIPDGQVPIVVALSTVTTGFDANGIPTTMSTTTVTSNTVTFALGTNNPPTVNPNGPYTVTEGNTVTVTATGADPDGDTLSYLWDLNNDGTFETPGQSVTMSAATLDGPSTHTISVKVTDSRGATAAAQTTAQVLNAAPAPGPIQAPLAPTVIHTAVTVNAAFSDPGRTDTHTAVLDWGDGTTSAGQLTENGGSGTVTGTHAYTTAGVYTLTLTLTDDDGASATATFRYMVIFDPDAGHVTGGGWINSPPGACTLDGCADATGKVNFGFVSKYHGQGGAPTGNTQLTFTAGNLNFHSTAYTWLVVAGPKAQYLGSGTINGNGNGNYGFFVAVTDGQLPGGEADRFRIKIWNTITGATVYDTQPGAPDDATPITPLGGGSIIIHSN